MIAAVFMALVLLFPAAPARAAAPTVTPSAPGANEAPDYASQYWSDPWDFNNPEDLNLTPRVNSDYVANLTMSGGNLSYDSSPGYIEPVWASGAFAHGRDAGIHPVNANAYNRISFRMYSGAAFDTAGSVVWFSCVGAPQSCQGAMSFLVKPGWNTYDLPITNTLGGIPWSGQIKVMRITAGNTPAHIEFDWIRLYQATGSSVNLNISGGYADEVWYDSDSDPGNNDPAQLGGKSAGRVAGYTPDGGSVSFSTDAMPPGTYRFYSKQGGQVSAYSTPLVINALPEPVVIDPDIKGGEDYATVVRGDPWDFSQASDAASIKNTSWWFSDGALRGTYGGPSPNDPQIVLPLAGSINASLYHRLTFRVYYDGPFGLEDAPGGGMLARVIWMIYQGGAPGYHDSQDMVIFPGWQDVTVDLKTNPPSLAEDESSTNPIGWGGPLSGMVSGFRFDPHEDPGGRTWFLDEIALRRDDRGNPNFNIQFQDNAWESGTTAEIWADVDAGGFNGFLIASGVPVNPGVNNFNWNGSGIPDWGIWWIHVKITDPGGTVGRSYSTGPVEMSPPPDVTSPVVNITGPSGPVAVGDPVVTATVSDAAPSSGIDAASATLSLDGGIAKPCTVTGADVTCPTSGLDNGTHNAVVSVADNGGNTGSDSGSFDVSGQSYDSHSSFFTWYDNVGASDWVIMANPQDSADDISFRLLIGGGEKVITPLSGQAPGQAHPGQSVYAIQPGLVGGPVRVDYKAIAGTGDRALASQRILWAGKSLEEVLAADSTKLASHFYWTWYDQQTPGFANWLMVANPGPDTVYYEIRIGGVVPGGGGTGSIASGGYALAAFPGAMGGPVEVRAWSGNPDPDLGTPADVLASQRVLADYGAAFNEAPGIPADELSSNYLWTWYDSEGTDGRNWIMVGNKSDGPAQLYYKISVGGIEKVQCEGPLAPNGFAFWSSDGIVDGPVGLSTYSDSDCTAPAESVASQRILWGPSFDEVAGQPLAALTDTWYWTWYDQESPGALNWVMVAPAPGETDVITVEVSFVDEDGVTRSSGPHDIDPVAPELENRRWYWTSPGTRGGPVKVTAYQKDAPGTPKPVVVSQRILWNGYFNEVLGTSLD